MTKAIKRYFPVFVLPTLIAFTIGFLAPFVLGVYSFVLQIHNGNRSQYLLVLGNYDKDTWESGYFFTLSGLLHYLQL